MRNLDFSLCVVKNKQTSHGVSSTGWVLSDFSFKNVSVQSKDGRKLSGPSQTRGGQAMIWVRDNGV